MRRHPTTRSRPSRDAGRRIEAAVRACPRARPLVLAVSGGRDSMALLHAAARTRHTGVAMVATFDHGTGPFAERAAALVAREAIRLGLPVVVGRAPTTGANEAEWRAARWEFLSRVARDTGGVIVTGHTKNDQVETVLMRVLRHAGARGLAGLYADSSTARPLLAFTRDEISEYARAADVRWMDDPSNASHAFLRNRVRHDLLPALRAVRPEIEEELLDIAHRAADARRQIDARAALVPARVVATDALSIPATALDGRTADELALLWPALAWRIGLAMDWRGTERLAGFTTKSRPGSRIPLSGGWEVARTRDRFELRHAERRGPPGESLPLAAGIRWEAWRFEPASSRDGGARRGAWVAQLPHGASLSVRRWRPGDRMQLGAGVDRKVKRCLSDAGVSGPSRERWPVVLANDEIVWIPGVRRSDAAAVRPGRPGVLYRCEFDYG